MKAFNVCDSYVYVSLFSMKGIELFVGINWLASNNLKIVLVNKA
jgi:hypothetical protein